MTNFENIEHLLYDYLERVCETPESMADFLYDFFKTPYSCEGCKGYGTDGDVCDRKCCNEHAKKWLLKESTSDLKIRFLVGYEAFEIEE